MADLPSSSSDRESMYSEALAQWSTRYHDPSGFVCQLSLEADSGVEALKKAEGAITHLIDLKCQPIQIGNGNNGNHKSELPPQQPLASGNAICPIHGIEMMKWSKGGRTWFSHRWNDTWCQGEDK